MIFVVMGVHFSSLGAASGPTLGEPTFSGSGCQSGTVSSVLSPDDQTLTVLFDDYRVDAGNGTQTDVKECFLLLPIQIPSGYTLTIFKVDYRGFNSLPKGAQSTFLSEYVFQGSPDPKRKKVKSFKGPLMGDFYESSSEQAKSLCGGENKLKIHTVLTVQSNSQQDQAFAQIDSKDMTSPNRKEKRKMTYKMMLKRCSGT
jgi:hypothetical protein